MYFYVSATHSSLVCIHNMQVLCSFLYGFIVSVFFLSDPQIYSVRAGKNLKNNYNIRFLETAAQ